MAAALVDFESDLIANLDELVPQKAFLNVEEHPGAFVIGCDKAKSASDAKSYDSAGLQPGLGHLGAGPLMAFSTRVRRRRISIR